VLAIPGTALGALGRRQRVAAGRVHIQHSPAELVTIMNEVGTQVVDDKMTVGKQVEITVVTSTRAD